MESKGNTHDVLAGLCRYTEGKSKGPVYMWVRVSRFCCWITLVYKSPENASQTPWHGEVSDIPNQIIIYFPHQNMQINSCHFQVSLRTKADQVPFKMNAILLLL